MAITGGFREGGMQLIRMTYWTERWKGGSWLWILRAGCNEQDGGYVGQ